MRSLSRYLRLMLGAIALAVTQACVSGAGFGVTSVSYGVGFYQPWGYDYGFWGPTYRVGPPRRGPWRRQTDALASQRSIASEAVRCVAQCAAYRCSPPELRSAATRAGRFVVWRLHWQRRARHRYPTPSE
jgi:hypothetical protein